MDTGKITRKRAVQLKAEALVLLNNALIAAWQKNSTRGKLTREEKARLLGVSVATSERILRCRGVDRPSLAIAFKNVGLVWSDEYCEHTPLSETSTLPLPVVEELTDPPSHVRTGRVRIAVAAVICLFLAAAFTLPSIYAKEARFRWQADFNQKVTELERAYNTAQYDKARVLADEAIEMARSEGHAAQLAASLRMIGDLEATAGNLPAAKMRYEESIAIRRGLNQLPNLPPILEALGNALTKLEDFEAAHQAYSEALSGFEQQNDIVGVAMAARGLGYLELERGRYDEAIRWSEKSIASARKANKRANELDAWACIAMIRRDQGQLDEAESILNDCMKYWSSEKHPRWMAKMTMLLASVKLKRGENLEATKMLEESRRKYSVLGDKEGVAECNDLILKAAGITKP